MYIGRTIKKRSKENGYEKWGKENGYKKSSKQD